MTMQPDMERLQRLLAIAFRTDNQHEAMSAIKAIRRTLAKSEHDVHWLVDRLVKPAAPWLLEPAHVADPEEMLRYCGEDVSLLMLNDRELEFILSLGRQRAHYGDRFRLTMRQARWLKGIYERLRVTRTA